MIRDIINEIKGSKYPIPSLDDAKVDVWASWFKGDVKNIHNYTGFDGRDTFRLKLKTMGMAKRICEDWADLLLNERTDIVLSNDDATKQLNKILRETNFWVKANEGVEKSFALGLGAFVIGVDNIQVGVNSGEIKKDNGKLRIDFVDRFKITPITIENKVITESAFTVEGSKETHYIVHVRDEKGIYIIHNFTYDNEKKEITNEYKFDTKSSKPLFYMIRPFIVSNDLMRNYDTDLGVSIFANAIDTLQAIDTKYDSFDNEFIAGRKRLFTNEEIWNVHNKKDGTIAKEFNPLQSIFYKLPARDDGSKVEDSSGPLRATEHILALNTELSILSDKCGMGVGYYKFDGSGAVTATQVVSENSDLFRSVKKHEILLEAALYGMTEVLIELSKIFTAEPIDIIITEEDDIRILFDDSIIEDKGAEMERDKSFVAAGLMSPVEFRVKWMGENEEQATENYHKYFKHIIIRDYLPALTQGAMTPAQFVGVVYGKEDAEIAAYIEERLKQGSFNDFMDLYDGDES